MIQETIRFTGLSIPAADILFGKKGRKVPVPCPPSWARVEFKCDALMSNAEQRLDAWIAENITGRWASYQHSGSRMVVFFESDDDAVMFKLTGGETAWMEKD